MPPYKPTNCPISKFADLFGDVWVWLILREAFKGVSKFSELQKNTGAAKNILSVRLNRLVESNIFMRKDVGTSGPRYEYFLTEKGKSLKPLLLDILQWSETNLVTSK